MHGANIKTVSVIPYKVIVAVTLLGHELLYQCTIQNKKINLFRSMEVLHENVKHEKRNIRMATFLK
jgi:hypothetical protein